MDTTSAPQTDAPDSFTLSDGTIVRRMPDLDGYWIAADGRVFVERRDILTR